jgi:ubiquinone/menaquinone biosynthesis C-methylase UbiE
MLHRLQRAVLRFFFHHLYHRLAWAYDVVATTVSLGHWRDWILTALPFCEGNRILELAFGTGMLQAALLSQQGRMVAGLEESPQMGRLARRRLVKRAATAPNLARGRAQKLPYASGVFDTAVTTFPNEFVVDPETLAEVHRVLRPGGRLLILPVAWLTGKGLVNRAAAWLFAVTGQAPAHAPEEVVRLFAAPMELAGFRTAFQQVAVNLSTVLVILGTR